ncbi:Energy-coupling factor transporter ATP-binding protein EcfA2 OS=Streptomyces albaduncus OX=68172 GN=FHS32_000313 PE=4 SV=1 [Streptomyces griseoloalbus]
MIWVVDPEKYADAMLHERYLRPMAAHAEVMFVVLNQIDRLPGDAAEQVLDDLRRLLDEDGIVLGEYGEPGTTVLALSALTGDGVGDLREALARFVAERGAPARGLSADADTAAARLWPADATRRRAGLSEEAREEASPTGSRTPSAPPRRARRPNAPGLRNANRACGTPWLRLWRWCQARREPATGRVTLGGRPDEEVTARQRRGPGGPAVHGRSDRAPPGGRRGRARQVRDKASAPTAWTSRRSTRRPSSSPTTSRRRRATWRSPRRR